MIFTKLKKICDERGISIRLLEREAGISVGSICKWDESSPTLEKLNAVCNVLEITIDSLVNEEEKAG